MISGKIQFKTVFLGETLAKDKRIDSLTRWGEEFDQQGTVSESKGNLSFRTKSGFIITGTGTALGKLKTDDLAEVIKVEKRGKEFIVYCNGKVIPSKESLFHNEIYKLRPEINAIFHTHDNLVLEAANKLNIPCTQKEQPSGSYQSVREIRKLLERKGRINYFVLRNHGVVSLGKNLTKAGALMKFMHKKGQS